MENKLLVLQIAFSLVADSPDFDIMTIDARIEEVRRAYDKLSDIMDDSVEGCETCQ